MINQLTSRDHPAKEGRHKRTSTEMPTVFDLLDQMEGKGSVDIDVGDINDAALRYTKQITETGDIDADVKDKIPSLTEEQQACFYEQYEKRKAENGGKEPSKSTQHMCLQMAMLKGADMTGLIPMVGLGTMGLKGIGAVMSPRVAKWLGFLGKSLAYTLPTIGASLLTSGGGEDSNKTSSTGNDLVSTSKQYKETKQGFIPKDDSDMEDLDRLVTNLLPSIFPLIELGEMVFNLIEEAELIYAEIENQKRVAERSFGKGAPENDFNEEIGGIFGKAWKKLKKAGKGVGRMASKGLRTLNKIPGMKLLPGGMILDTAGKIQKLGSKAKKIRKKYSPGRLMENYNSSIANMPQLQYPGSFPDQYSSHGIDANVPYLSNMRSMIPGYNAFAGQMGAPTDAQAKEVAQLDDLDTPRVVLGTKNNQVTPMLSTKALETASLLSQGTAELKPKLAKVEKDDGTLVKVIVPITDVGSGYLVEYTSSPFSFALRPRQQIKEETLRTI